MLPVLSSPTILPVWAQILITAAAVTTASYVLWAKLLHPSIRFASYTEELVPLARELALVFRDSPNAFRVLEDMARQVPPMVVQIADLTARSVESAIVVARIEAAATAARLAAENGANVSREAAEHLKVGVEAQKLLSEQDRAQLVRLMLVVDRLSVMVGTGVDSLDRMAADRAEVAEDLIRHDAQEHARHQLIADDLSASHRRADEAQSSVPGEAADAASRSEQP